MAVGAKQTKNKNTAYKSAIYSVPLFLIGVLQVTFFAKINVLSATPDLLLASVVALALCEEHRVCTVCGIVAGFLYCALGTHTFPTYIVFSFLCAYVLWGVANRTFGKNYPSYLALSALAFALKVVYNLAEIALNSVTFNLIEAVWRIAVPEFISSVLFCTLPYLIITGINSIVNKKSKSRKDYVKR